MNRLLTPDAYRDIVQITNKVVDTFTLKVTQCCMASSYLAPRLQLERGILFVVLSLNETDHINVRQ